MLSLRSRGWMLAVLAATVVMAGCSTRTPNRAPVEDRGSMSRPAAPGAVVAADPNAKPLPGIENAGKPGYYTVKPGDTVIRIGLETGQNWRDIARWNNLENPNLIEVGQVVRVVPPIATTAAAAPVSPASAASAPAGEGVITRPVTSGTVMPAGTPTAAASAARPASAAAPAATPAPVAGGDDELAWIWPVNGQVIAGFDEAKNKGVDIAGKAGDPVLASADGRVVYAGAGLRGYGNLIILKHNNTYLTAYAHNQTLLVKEDQSVRKGQKIAEMGSSDADRVKLHFEIRRQGKPVDPARYLPSR
ncbi:MAG: peptidoglycan DD-metalloendopeptidase family protein [Burkholderiaceae bacterium]